MTFTNHPFSLSFYRDLESASKFELLLKVEELQGDLKLKEKDLKSKDLEINRWKEQVNKLNLESVPRQALEDFQKQYVNCNYNDLLLFNTCFTIFRYDVAIEKNSNLHEQLHAKTQELADIKKENDNLYQRINEKADTEQSKNKFYEQLKATKSELELLTIAHNTLKEKYKEKDREVEYYKNELREVNLENSQLREVISASRKRKSLNISSVSLLEGSFSFSGDIDPRASPPKSIVGETIADMLVPVLEEEKKALSAANDLANQKNTELQNEMKSLVSSMNVLKEDSSKLFASKKALSAANDLANQKNIELQNENNSLVSLINNLKDEISQLYASKESLTSDLASKSNENQQLIVNLETFEFQITELQSEVKQKDDVICDLQNQIDSLASSNNVLKDDYSQMSASKELLTINLASKSSENQRLRASLELCESQKASAFQQIEFLEQKIKNLESGDNSKCNENQKLRATLELCENQRDSALKRVELLENEVKSKKEAFRKLSAELKLEQQSFEMERKTKERLIKENAKLELINKKLKSELDALAKIKTEVASSEKCSSEKVQCSNCSVSSLPLNSTIGTASFSSLQQQQQQQLQQQQQMPYNNVSNYSALQPPSHRMSSRFEVAEEEGQFMDPGTIDGAQLFGNGPDEANLSRCRGGSVAQNLPCFDLTTERLQQLAHRNSMLQPHLRSTYPVELQVADVQALPGSDENSIRRGSVQSLCSAASSLSRSHTSDSTTSISTAEFFAPLGPPPARRQTRSQMNNGGTQRPAGLSIENLGPSRPQHSMTASTSQASTSPSRSRRKSPITYSVSVEDIPQKRSR